MIQEWGKRELDHEWKEDRRRGTTTVSRMCVDGESLRGGRGAKQGARLPEAEPNWRPQLPA